MVKEATFGELIVASRKDKKLQQDEFARLVSEVHRKTVGASTISRIEQQAVPVSLGLGRSIIKALKPTKELKDQMLAALNAYIAGFELPAPYKSGEILSRFMEEADITNRVMAEVIHKSHQVVQAWRAGIGLMSDDMLFAVSAELNKRGIKRHRLVELTSQHAVDVIMTMPRLTYLSKAQRKRLADCLIEIIQS